MYLKKIELHGFKSFADKVNIEFQPGITGIVGPNGCGKSNISDAVRWVLGEQSVKSLRGSNMADVIFAGSQDRRAQNLAEVTLIFDNSDRMLNYDYNEVEITRRLYRQGNEAEYLLNRQQCRLKDITDLLLDTGLGRDSLSIISQGNISNFADSRPEERRAIFEEAAGVSKYKKRKIEAIRKLERTTDNLNRIKDIVYELEKQIAPLKKQKEKAEVFLTLKEKLTSIEVNVLVHEVSELKHQLDTLSLQLKDLKEATKGTKIKVGAQNMHFETSGAFTGEVSAEMLQEIGMDYVIIGHSERREYFGETDETVNKKVLKALQIGINPILCCGETLEQREAGKTEEVITKQVELALAGLTEEQVKNTIIAYEPIWAIGTGKTATSEDANNSIKAIRKKISEIYGSVAEDVIIQYGGSVKSTNAKELFETSDIDGALVGGASLKVDEFAKIVNYNK